MLDSTIARVGAVLGVLAMAGACGDSSGDDDDTSGADAGGVAPDASGGAPDAGAPPADTLHSILAGRFAPLPAYAGMAFDGRAQLVRTLDDRTRVQLQVTGLAADTAHNAHVHALPCAFLAGGHYKIDPAEAETVEDNELWPTFTTDADGVGWADAAFDHVARGDAMAIVVHDPAGGAKMACADLAPTEDGDVTATGAFAPFAAAETVDDAIAGAATLVRTATTTEVAIDVTGLAAAEDYRSHVHALPCAVTDGGGHYKLDPTVADTVDTNELWPAIGEHADGTASDSFEHPSHVARADAQSIVIHRVTTDGAPKVACADLVRDAWPALRTAGDATVLDAAVSRGLGSMTAEATMTRDLQGRTIATLSATGLQADTEYPVHVHDRSCDIADGGAHYVLDPAQPGSADNEMWLTLTTDGAGTGTATTTVLHTARPEAQSIVIHDAADGARLACIDLL